MLWMAVLWLCVTKNLLAQMDTIFLQPFGGFWEFPTVSYILDFSARDDIEINEVCLTSYVPRFELLIKSIH